MPGPTTAHEFTVYSSSRETKLFTPTDSHSFTQTPFTCRIFGEFCLVSGAPRRKHTDGNHTRSSYMRMARLRLPLALLVVIQNAFALQSKPPLVPRRLYMDWVALNSKSTTRQLMRPRTDQGRAECLALKLKIREEAANGAFVVDAFVAAAKEHSIDAESRDEGGLIGRRIRQGVCRDPDLDKACFCSPLGKVCGPILSGEGWHLVLVEERLGLEMHDSGMSRVIPQPRGDGEGVASVLAGPDPEEVPEILDSASVISLIVGLGATIVGGELLSRWASSIDVGAIAESMN